MLLAWCLAAGCAAPPPPTPTATPAVIHALATGLTEPLLLDLAGAEARLNRGIVGVPELAPADSLAAQVAAGQAHLGLTIEPAPELFATPLGYVTLRVVVHPSNAVAALEAEQLRAIFTGQAAEWEQVGRHAGQIQVVTREATSDAARLFAERVMPAFPLTTTVH